MSAPILLSAYDAKRCARRIHNEWTPGLRVEPWEAPATLQLRWEVGRQHEATVGEELRNAVPSHDLVDLTGITAKAACVAATVAAMDARAAVVLGGWLPDDTAGGRTGRPDLLVHIGDGRYAPGDVKGHQVVRRLAKGTLSFSPMSGLARRESMDGLTPATTDRVEDYLQLAHYWRMLEALGRAPDAQPRGFIIGTDHRTDLTPDGRVAVWIDLAAPHFATYSRSQGRALRSALERYDHEHGFRLRVAEASVTGAPALVQPIFTSECDTCPWLEHCQSLVGERTASRHITSGRLTVREWQALEAQGIVDLDDLAALDPEDPAFQAAYLPEVTHLSDAVARLALAVRRARMLRDGVMIERETTGAIPVPRADVEIDLDIEWDPEDRVYLWGALVTRPGQDPEYLPIATFDEIDDDGAILLARQFAAWLRAEIAQADAAGQSLLVYHYSHPEPTYLKRLLGEAEATDLLACFVDLLAVVREHYFGVRGLGIKKVAPAFGFQWRDDDPGGLQSQLWLLEARSAHDGESRETARQRLLAYNEDDVRATRVLREGLTRTR